MKLVVGLGNPGRRYEGTRHNVGFAVLGELARRWATRKPRARFHGEIVEADLNGQRVLLLSPLTYMNRSGLSVREAKEFYKLADEEVLVVCDDIHLPLGKLRFRARGSAGGQKGLEDVIQQLGTDAVPRLRIGVGSPPAGWDWADYVLARFHPEEQAEMALAIPLAAEAVVAWTREGIEYCMTRYNARAGAKEEQETPLSRVLVDAESTNATSMDTKSKDTKKERLKTKDTDFSHEANTPDQQAQGH
jgi:PTH1 family peptidyl-tRNA hydrolase